MPPKPIRIRLSDKAGKAYHWTIQRVPRSVNCLIGNTRIISGWKFTDHDGYERFAEGTWRDLVAMFRTVAENYGFKIESGLD
jgi:hypothetical protein